MQGSSYIIMLCAIISLYIRIVSKHIPVIKVICFAIYAIRRTKIHTLWILVWFVRAVLRISNVYHIKFYSIHYNEVTMNAMAPKITSLTIVCSTVYSGADQRKHQSSASLAFVCGIHRWPVKSQYRGNVSIWWRHHVTIGFQYIWSTSIWSTNESWRRG